MIKKVLVATDGSEHAKKAIDYASDIASKYDATLYFIHVIANTEIPEDLRRFIEVEGIKEPPQSVYLRMIGEKLIEVAEERARKKGVKNVQSTVVQGDPAERIVEFAKEIGADMLVLGSRGLGNLKGMFLGSVSSKVCHLAHCTCVTIK